MTKKKYSIVFDFDETLGHFGQPYKFWYYLKKFLNSEKLHENYFFSFLDLFPEFFRTNIFKILKYIKKKKIAGDCDYVMIYTNNNGPNYWVNMIVSYIHKKLKYKLFDQIIRAFKVNGKIIEVCRSSYSKSYKDLLSCTKLPSTTQICFIDDQQHPDMQHNNVRYIYIQHYTYNIAYDVVIEKYFKENTKLFNQFNKTKYEFINYMKILSEHDLEYLNKTKVEKNIDILISKNIENNIKKFLREKSKYTRYKRKLINTRTRRN